MGNAANSKARYWPGILMLAVALLASCGKAPPEATYAPALAAPPVTGKVTEYSFGVTPMSDFRDVYDVFQPIIERLNAGLPPATRLVLEVPRGLAEHGQQLQSRRFAFALSNPYHSWRAVQQGGYRIFAKMGDDSAFRGVWVVRRDSALRTLADFKGKRLSFPPRSALAATMMTQLQLKQHGIDPASDAVSTYVGSQHSAIMQVATGQADAGATWPLAWTTFQRVQPEQARGLEVRFRTAPLINQGIVARADLPPELVQRVAELMMAMNQDAKGRALLAAVPIVAFEGATDAQYDVVRSFMDEYKKSFPAGPDG